MWTDGWSLERPTEPGLYLFYGELEGHVPARFALCYVQMTDRGPKYVVEWHVLDASELAGAFKPFDVKPPPLDHMRRIANPPKVSPEQIAALVRWREQGMDQIFDEARDKALCSLREWSGPPPKGHEDALYAFQALSYYEQLKAVCDALHMPLPSEPGEDDE